MIKKIFYSIFPGLLKQDKSGGKTHNIFRSLLFHFRPRKVNSRTLDFTLTFGLGGMALVLILLLFVTGLFMKFYYLPFPDRAYESILYLKSDILFGPLVRNMHYWSANLLIIIGFLHLLRVFFTSAFHPPRQFNWIIGLILFVIILLFNFTGYLLPWDQLSYWAVTICTGMMEYVPYTGKWIQTTMRGGAEVSESTLSIFYSTHTALLPALLIIIMPFHFWRVRRAGGVVVPSSTEDENDISNGQVDTVPHLILREIVTALVLIAVIFFVSILFDAPLGDKANPGLSPNPTKAPWYFMGFQEILLHLHPMIAISVIPFLIFLGLLSIPYNQYPAGREGVWFVSSRGRSIYVVTFIFALFLTTTAVILDEYILAFSEWLPGLNPVISTGLFPFFIFLFGYFLFYLFLIKRDSPDKNEKVQMVFLFFLTAFIFFTITGIWFRGSSMKLVWPWFI